MSKEIQRRDGYVLFWDGYLSNWHPAGFTIDGITYEHAEQWMMASKARVFNDKDSLAKILGVYTDPATQETKRRSVSAQNCKALGKTVKPYVDEQWKAVAREWVYVGVLEKFRQNPSLAEQLLATGDDIVVEASPYDTIWGIGLSANHPDATVPEKWRGTNWLGQVLMLVRDALRTEGSHDGKEA